VLGDGFFDRGLSALGTHILIVGGEHDSRLCFDSLHDGVDLNSARDIASAPADKHADSLQ
jgi:hypothetical protein